MNKVYILFNKLKNEVEAISEDKNTMLKWLLQLRYNKSDYELKKASSDSKLGELYLILYEDLYLIENGTLAVALSKDCKLINDTLNSFSNQMDKASDTILDVVDSFELSEKEKVIVLETSKILSKKSTDKGFYKSFKHD